MINDLDYEGIEFPDSKNFFDKIKKKKKKFALMYFAMKIN